MRILFAPSDVAVPQPPARTRNRVEIPDRFKWNLDDIFHELGGLGGGVQPARAGHRALRRAEGHAGAGSRAAARGVPAVGGARAAGVSRLVLSRRCATTRTSATTPSTRAASRCSSCSRAGSRRSPGSIPSCSASRSRPCAAGWTSLEALRLYRFAIEDLYRQQEHVLDEAGERLMSLASRLSSAPNEAYSALSTADVKFPTITLSTGEEVVDLVRSVPRHSRDPARAGGPRHARSRRCTTPTSRRSTPTPRSTTASASATGSRRAPAATRARSRRRCTATTSRPPSSRT